MLLGCWFWCGGFGVVVFLSYCNFNVKMVDTEPDLAGNISTGVSRPSLYHDCQRSSDDSSYAI